MRIKVCSYNIHKGFTQFNRRLIVHDLREHLTQLDLDILFLQEVQGAHTRHSNRHPHWPKTGQHEFLAQDYFPFTAYLGHAVYKHGHHGNAILSRKNIAQIEHQDISAHRFERRSLLHCVIPLEERQENLHCLCVHLALNARGRKAQYEDIVTYIKTNIPWDAPLILAGDFNDWRNHADRLLADVLDLKEVFSVGATNGQPARSFPSRFPLFRLDRIYTRGFRILQPEVHHGHFWGRLSDHAPITAELELL